MIAHGNPELNTCSPLNPLAEARFAPDCDDGELCSLQTQHGMRQTPEEIKLFRFLPIVTSVLRPPAAYA